MLARIAFTALVLVPTGGLTPFRGAPEVPTLTAADKATLARGDDVKRQVSRGESAFGLVVQDIHAPPDVVFERVIAIEDYAEMITSMQASTLYKKSATEKRAKFTIGALGLSLDYHAVYTINPAGRWTTWTLDPTKDNELEALVGGAVIRPHPDKPGWTRAVYMAEGVFSRWMPSFAMDLVRKVGLHQATEWVKRESEARAKAARARARPPSSSGRAPATPRE